MATETDLPATSDAPEPRSPRQLSLLGVIGTWAAAALPMGLLAWLVAPWIAGLSGWRHGLPGALLVALTMGLVWQFVLVLILVGREQGSLRWPVLKDSLWLRAPLSPKTGRRGGRLWWAVPILLVALIAVSAIPVFPAPAGRDFVVFLQSDSGTEMFAGSWGWFAVVVLLLVFNTALGEELLFRGYLLPRMGGVFGRWDWLGNAGLFGFYHLHTIWALPVTLLSGVIFAWSAKRYRSAVVPILVNSAQSIVVIALTFRLVLG